MNEEETLANDELDSTTDAADAVDVEPAATTESAEVTEAEVLTEAVDTEMPETEAEQDIVEDEDAPAEPAKPKHRLRRFLVWAIVIFGLFAMGVAALWYVQMRPLSSELEATRVELEAAQEELDALRPLEEENAQLTGELEETESHLRLLSVLVNVTSAQLALAQDNPVVAKAALAGTMESLVELQETLSPEDAETVDGLIERLELVQREIDTDEFAAMRDLEILANNLLLLERSLFR
jgi:hypothetical protein